MFIKRNTRKNLNLYVLPLITALLLLLSSCGRREAAVTSYSPHQIAEVIVAAQANISVLHPLIPEDSYYTDYLSNIYQIDDEKVKDGIICYADGMLADEIAILLISDSADANEVRDLLSAYKTQRANTFMGYAPDQAAILENGTVVTSGNYVALLVCEDAKNAESVFQMCFSENPPSLPDSNDKLQPLPLKEQADAAGSLADSSDSKNDERGAETPDRTDYPDTSGSQEATVDPKATSSEQPDTTIRTQATNTPSSAARPQSTISPDDTDRLSTTDQPDTTSPQNNIDNQEGTEPLEATDQPDLAGPPEAIVSPDATISPTADITTGFENSTNNLDALDASNATDPSKQEESQVQAKSADETNPPDDITPPDNTTPPDETNPPEGTNPTEEVKPPQENSYLGKVYPAAEAVTAEDLYRPRTIITAWKSGNASSLSQKNRIIFEACAFVINTVIRSGMSDYEKELAIHDWIIDWASYDTEAKSNAPNAKPDPDNENPYSVLINKKGICSGFTSTFQLFMDLVDVECITVNGTANYGNEHAWNMVRIDGEWYCVDVTWNNPTASGNIDPQATAHRYFNVTSQFMWDSSHRWDRSTTPEATAPKLYY